MVRCDGVRFGGHGDGVIVGSSVRGIDSGQGLAFLRVCVCG